MLMDIDRGVVIATNVFSVSAFTYIIQLLRIMCCYVDHKYNCRSCRYNCGLHQCFLCVSFSCLCGV
jgi:hypothetical protein